jgi:glycerol kinase
VIVDGVPVSAILGDQQAALFGQAAYEAGEAKNSKNDMSDSG